MHVDRGPHVSAHAAGCRRQDGLRAQGLRAATGRAPRRMGGVPLGGLDRPRSASRGARDGEIDFVLCRPDKPLLCLEVKGGGIESRYGEWYRTEPDGTRERIPDPFGQALDHRYDLERLLERSSPAGAGRKPMIASRPRAPLHDRAPACPGTRRAPRDHHRPQRPSRPDRGSRPGARLPPRRARQACAPWSGRRGGRARTARPAGRDQRCRWPPSSSTRRRRSSCSPTSSRCCWRACAATHAW